jgi:hypothetical protein
MNNPMLSDLVEDDVIFARTSYFRVNDRAALEAVIAPYGVHVIEAPTDAEKLAIVCDGDWPDIPHEPDSRDYITFRDQHWGELIQPYLLPDEAVVLKTVGIDGESGSLIGRAVAINAHGQTGAYYLDMIYEEKLGNMTAVEYADRPIRDNRRGEVGHPDYR